MYESRRMFVFSIGINAYANYRRLQFCENDAVAFPEAVSRRFGPVRTRILSHQAGSDPTASKVRETLTEIAELDLGEEDTILFFFAGHGEVVDGRDCLICSDSVAEDHRTKIHLDDVIGSLRSSGAGTAILVIDACRDEISRATALFGEFTAELARRKGVIVFHGCSPGEVCQEVEGLGPGHGVFTFSFIHALDGESLPTPLSLDQLIRAQVEEICQEQELRQQRPYTTVAPVQKATVNLFTGEILVHTGGSSRKCVLVVGPTNAGKTSLGQWLASKLGFVHIEMSSFAWQRFQADPEYQGSIQDFMEEVVWLPGDEDVIARDLIEAHGAVDRLVVCGPRRPEEIETIRAQGWDIYSLYVFANASLRFRRHRRGSTLTRLHPSYQDFARRDLREYGWGLAKIGGFDGFQLLINEGTLDQLFGFVARRVELPVSAS